MTAPSLPLPLPRASRPDAGLAALESFRAHHSPRVQNRVGDDLRRLARRQPVLVTATCRRWLAESPSPATRRIVRRALRTGAGDAGE
ncbi:MAG: hypothetical protein RLN63_05925 [Miltoncostaeaceae bacterium]